MNLHKFKIGDRVRCISGYYSDDAIVTNLHTDNSWPNSPILGIFVKFDNLTGMGELGPFTESDFILIQPVESEDKHLCWSFKTYIGFTDTFDYCATCQKRKT